MADPDGMGQAEGILGPGRPHCFIEGVGQEIVAGFRLDRDEAVQVVRLQQGL
jgi:hypothetical protein